MIPKLSLLKKIREQGGWVNTHAHLDRAYTITPDNFHLKDATLKEKWDLNDQLKRSSTVDQIYSRMARATEYMIEQGVQALGTFIDVDEAIEDKAIKAAQKLRENYGKEIVIKFANQTLKGVIDPVARHWFEVGAQFVDIIGGLPGRDKGHESEHLDILLTIAHSMKKMVHVHVDQLNTAAEKETELLADKTIQHQMQGRICAVHCISVAAHPKPYRDQLYQKMKKADLMVIACPIAWIDARRTEKLAPSHNAVTPIDEMVPAGITVALGTDNIADIYKPFTDGTMWTELQVMLEACRFGTIDELANIASINGLKILGL